MFLKYAVSGLALIFSLTASMAQADQLVFWTNFSSRTLVQGNVTTSTNTIIDPSAPPAGTAGNPDSLIFDTKGNIIYTVYNGSPGQVRMFDGSTDSLIASGFGSQLVDIALDPSGNSVLVADRGNGNLDRVDLTTHAVSILSSGLNTVDGIAYDTKTGGLFALLTPSGAGGQKLVQIDPTTGAILNTGDAGFNAGFLDGLGYDPVSDKFYAASGGCLQTFDPNAANLAHGACVGSFSFIDGVESDAAGHILVADVGAGKIGQYTLAGGTSSYILSAAGLDDIAPVAGLGAPTPEPNSVVLLGGMAGLIFWISRKRLAKS